MKRTPPGRFFAVFFIAILMLWGCGDQTPNEAKSNDQALPHVELFQEAVDPLFVVDIPDRATVRELFADGVAHLQPQKSFRQVSGLMDAEDLSGFEYSALLADGTWTEWREVETIWYGDIFYSALIRLDEPATELKLRGGEGILETQLEFFEEVLARDEFVFPNQSHDAFDPADDLATTRQAIAPSSLVISRSQWGAINPGNTCSSLNTPNRMAIHHTGTPSNDGGDPAARMRSMQSHHINVNGWCDIGYHFVVSQSGLIFQGRSNSREIGAHVGGQNTRNLGISFIANFNSQTPTGTQLDTGAKIMRWVHDTHGVPLNRDNILGHREHSGQTTSCPGDNMIPMIDELIRRAGSDDEPEPPPAGGCIPSADDDASNNFFKDFRSDATGYDEAILLYNANITRGCSGDPLMFCPNCPLTRSQMATLLVRAANLDISNPPSQATFDDVPLGHRNFEYIEAAAAAGITAGCDADNFCPGDEITRAQLATMIHRAAGWPDEIAADAPSFDDVGASSTHYPAVETLKQRCVTQGCGDGSGFCPDNSVTRGQAAVFIARSFNLENNNPCAEPGGCDAHAAFGTDDSLFADYPTDAFGYDEAALIFNAGITLGCSASPTMFCPNCSTNRRQMVVFLARAAELDVSNPPATATFSDVSPESSGFAEIEAAVDAGIVSGCGDDQFCPTDLVTRAQVATMITRAQGWSPLDPATSDFDDVAVGTTHFEGVQSLKDHCVTQGCAAGRFCPSGNVSRAHTAIFLARAFNLDDINPCADAPGSGDGPVTDPDIDLDDEDEDDPTDSCADVDPDFQDPTCVDDDGTGDGGTGDGDGGTGDGDGGEGDLADPIPGDGDDDPDADGDPSLDDDNLSAESGCACSTTAPFDSSFGLLLIAFGLFAIRRRKSAKSQ